MLANAGDDEYLGLIFDWEFPHADLVHADVQWISTGESRFNYKAVARNIHKGIINRI
jgi:hypothetical protein